ncbi:MAG: hypothetical protein JKY94_17135 [Rhodobacteraceae bacterium]|nr:hypothetical protein [Paracoccaceae bacterium]
MMIQPQPKSLPQQIFGRISDAPRQVWTPADFADIGNRDAVDKALQRMVKQDQLRRIERGFYDRPSKNTLTGKQTVPDYRSVIDAVARRDKVRWLIDGMTAANTLGLTNAVPAKIEVLVDARLKAITLGNQKIVFRHAAPSRLYWAGRPGMYLVQALHWLHDVMSDDQQDGAIGKTVRRLLNDKKTGPSLVDDLKTGLSAMPIWMQDMLRKPLSQAQGGSQL